MNIQIHAMDLQVALSIAIIVGRNGYLKKLNAFKSRSNSLDIVAN